MIVLNALLKFMADHWRGLLCYIAGILTFLLFLALCAQPTLQQKPQTHTVTIKDTVILRDTITRPVKTTVVIHKRVHDTLIVQDTTDGESIIEPVACYHAEQKFDDSAFVSVDMCSKEFPLVKPVDLTTNFKYLPAPEKRHYELRVDSIFVQPVVNKWKEVKTAVKWGSIGAVVAYVIKILISR
jgi:hypothetical protein